MTTEWQVLFCYNVVNYFDDGFLMVQLIKKGGLRERANRSRRYQDSENQQTTLKPNLYQKPEQTSEQAPISDITQPPFPYTEEKNT